MDLTNLTSRLKLFSHLKVGMGQYRKVGCQNPKKTELCAQNVCQAPVCSKCVSGSWAHLRKTCIVGGLAISLAVVVGLIIKFGAGNVIILHRETAFSCKNISGSKCIKT